MTSREMVESYIRTAAHIIKQAKMACADKVWHLAVRRCQECVEMALKAALRFVGVEVPKIDDVGLSFGKTKTSSRNGLEPRSIAPSEFPGAFAGNER